MTQQENKGGERPAPAPPRFGILPKRGPIGPDSAQGRAEPGTGAHGRGRIRVMLVKVGLDGHDRGIRVVTRALRDAGMEVIYVGLWQTPEAAVRSAVQEDVSFLGFSFLSGAHLALMPKVFEALKSAGAAEDIDVLVGGIIPRDDYTELERMGVAKVFGPGSGLSEIVSFIQQRWARRTGPGAPGSPE